VAPEPVAMTVDEIFRETGGGPPRSGRERECCWGKRCPRSDHPLVVSWRGHITAAFELPGRAAQPRDPAVEHPARLRRAPAPVSSKCVLWGSRAPGGPHEDPGQSPPYPGNLRPKRGHRQRGEPVRSGPRGAAPRFRAGNQRSELGAARRARGPASGRPEARGARRPDRPGARATAERSPVPAGASERELRAPGRLVLARCAARSTGPWRPGRWG
jgi:hypothetical protein